MDLSQLNLRENASNAHAFSLKHPVTGEKTDATLMIVGRESDAYRAASAHINRRLADLKGDDGKPRQPTQDELAKIGAIGLAALVVGWSNIYHGQDEVQYTPERALELFRDPGFDWIAKQVMEEANDRANFTKVPPKT